MRFAPQLLALCCLAAVLPHRSPAPPDRARPNDNRVPAGRLRNGVLTIALEVRTARWYPGADDGPSIDLPVFAEVGQAPSIPGPLIRVPAGTVIAATVTNRLADSTIMLQGFATRPAEGPDSTTLAPGESRTFRFAAGAAGTYFYRARLGGHRGNSPTESEQLAGAFVVDPPGRVAPDRIFVINIWGAPKDSLRYLNALGLNGKAWPHTERLELPVGDSVRWRIINASDRPHPMHLHGFYYEVRALGTLSGDTAYAPGRRPVVVTVDMEPGSTMAMAWLPSRPGNWLFHCHIGYHVIPEAARYDTVALTSHDHDHMAGLVLGLHVSAPPNWAPGPRPDPARLRMEVAEGPPHDGTRRTITTAITPPGEPAVPAWPGPVLLAERGRPLDVTVVNRLTQSTTIHWHGLELDSYWDGVAGWSGMGTSVARPIAPADSFVAHLLVPRAGTFIYHTHLNDLSQLSAGLYGPLLVLEPGEPYDPRHDHVFTIGADSPDDDRVLVNGAGTHPALTLAAGSPSGCASSTSTSPTACGSRSCATVRPPPGG
ncbi:MAG: multicopper oxidase domain-containing protein [Gemmatimonadetes bacterium]|nr:multicopper oxidase domain-containing protein [Gemmatimonadota bacterium]